ncbi:MAG: hypothetical protein ACKVRP_10945 [Bacteroidota bacterium]
MRIPLYLVIVSAFFFLSSCETNDIGPTDIVGVPPTVGSAALSVNTVNIDTLVVSDDTYIITFSAVVHVTDSDGYADIANVEAEIVRPTASSPFLSENLADDGLAPDTAALDGIFSKAISFQVTRAQTGIYRIRFSSRDISNLRSNTTELALLITRTNTPPHLDAQSLVAPDTLTRPTSGFIPFFVSISALDKDGLADINQVYLKNLNSQNRDYLLDDGGIPQGGISSGDEFAGDGIFSVTLALPFDTPQGTYPFALQATDSFGDTSVAVPYTLTVQ